VLQAAAEETGLLGERLGCDVDGRGSLVIEGMGARYADFQRRCGMTSWVFDGPEIFRRAVGGMSQASTDVLAKHGFSAQDVDLVVPHQANLRIIEATAKRLKLSMERVIVTVDRHGNTSSGSVPLALDEAVRSGKVQRGQTLLLEAFGGGFTWASALLKY
jgi:3-oxoacyl-[acyl-carrier-protein] synthase-3